ncbi:MAG TPA: GNAT family N-acetyltransferase [Thermoplasmata archaeon]|nr:GNAT family N-acetyltransferase [Thermoplasmata archaeon]
MRIRPLEWRDFDDLVRTYYDCYDDREAGRFLGITLFDRKPSLAEEVSWFTGAFRRQLEGRSVVSIAEVDGHAVGNCTVGAAEGPKTEVAHIGILGILVNKDHRGRGLGTALMKDAIGRSKGVFEAIRLSVFTDNDGAIRLYERLGFVKIGRIPRAVKRGPIYYDEDLMILPL